MVCGTTLTNDINLFVHGGRCSTMSSYGTHQSFNHVFQVVGGNVGFGSGKETENIGVAPAVVVGTTC